MQPVRKHPQNPILVVDDEPSILLAIDTTLQMAGYSHVMTCPDSRRVMDLLDAHPVEVVLLDLTMPHVDGVQLLEMIRNDHPDIPVVVVTGMVDIDTAVDCMKKGAFDYIVKPVEEGRLLSAVSRALELRELRRENLALKQRMLSEELLHPEAFSRIITGNRKMLSIFQYIESIAPTSQPVLIRGETGVGKELIAKSIHALSGLKGGFVAVNVAGLDDNVFSDTLFGHVKGAFTGADRDRSGLIEKAAGGTLFLDEIGDLSATSQVKLLRLLQEREYFPLGSDEPKKTDARILASTHEDLRQLEERGSFRKDLNYRLNTHQILVPPLRERLDDIPMLVAFFLENASKELDKAKPAVPAELCPLLKTYTFPGNVRELQSLIFDAVSRHKSRVLSLEGFKSHMKLSQDHRSVTPFLNGEWAVAPLVIPGRFPTIRQATGWLVEEAMKRAGGNQSIAAGMLGISQQALSKRLQKKKEEPS